jgi:hypothetical protein
METLHCVGVYVKNTTPFLLVEIEKNGSFLDHISLLLLDETTSHLTNPFYDHIVELVYDVVGNYYTMKEWMGYKLRIDMVVGKTDTSFIANIKSIIKNSFFPMMVKTTTHQNWQKQAYSWDTYYKGLSYSYRKGFDVGEWLDLPEGGKCTTAQFWAYYREKYDKELKEVVESMNMDRSSVVVSIDYLYCVMDSWAATHSHINGYFKYRLIEMPLLWLITPLLLSTHGRPVINDMVQFSRGLVTLSNKGENGEERKYNDFIKLVQFVITKSWEYIPVNEKNRDHLIGALLLKFVVMITKKRLEQDASSVMPITVKTLLWNFNYIFGIKEELVSTRTFLVPTEPDDEWAGRDSFTKYHYEEVVQKSVGMMSHLYPEVITLATTVGEIKMNTPLFLLKKDDMLVVEENIRHIYQEKLIKEVKISGGMEWDVERWRDEYKNLDDVDRGLYHTRMTMLRFTTPEYKQLMDMDTIAIILEKNAWDTLVIRPDGSDYSLKRASLYFSEYEGTVKLEDFHKSFKSIKEATMNDPQGLIVVMDCHLLSTDAMKNLVTWFYMQRTVIKRVVMIGVDDVLPLCGGQSFLDLIQWSDYASVNSGLFAHDVYHEDLLKLVDLCGGLTLCDKSSLESTIKEMVRPRRPLVKLCVIISPKEAASRFKKDTLNLVKDGLTLKFISNHSILIVPITLEGLVGLDQTTGYEKEWVLFLIHAPYLKQLTRNETNHLLLETHNLLVITDKVKQYDSKKGNNWFKKFIKPQKYPNIRYTLPHMKRLLPLFDASLCSV